jgi:hypothetical protein
MIFLNESNTHIGAGTGADAADLDKMLQESGINAADYDVFTPDAIGSLELVCEMETDWATLNMEMATVEHNSIVNESVEVLHEGLKEFWGKVKEFFKKIWASISSFFKKMWDKMVGFFRNAEKWWKDNQAKISASAKAKVDVYPNVANGTAMEKIAAASAGFRELQAASMEIESTKDVNKLIKALDKAKMPEKKEAFVDMLGADDTSEVEVKKDAIGKTLVGSNVVLVALKAGNAAMAKTISSAIKVADTAQKNTEGKEADLNKKKVDAFKKILSTSKGVEGLIVTAANKAVSNAFMAGRALLAVSSSK